MMKKKKLVKKMRTLYPSQESFKKLIKFEKNKGKKLYPRKDS